MEFAETVNEAWAECARDLRDIAQQCYLLIGLAEDPEMKLHLLDLGLRLEQRAQLIEREAAARRSAGAAQAGAAHDCSG
ncbi:MAG TPA: hypothetical protein VF502_07230 [Stellaceae bacterium]